MTSPLTKDKWIAACAARFAEVAGLSLEESTAYAEGCFDAAIQFEGSEAAALESDPVEVADADMSYWEE